MKVTIHYLWSKKNKWGSNLISWASNKHTPLKNSPAHIALLINEKWVFESTYAKDVSITGYKQWKIENIETHKLQCTLDKDYDEIKAAFKPLKGKKYDWYGISYFVWRFILFLLFRRPLPAKNKWEKKDRYFCCEAVGSITGEDYSMMTPTQVYHQLKAQLK